MLSEQNLYTKHKQPPGSQEKKRWAKPAFNAKTPKNHLPQSNIMKKYFENLASVLFNSTFKELDETQQHVIKSIANREPIAANPDTAEAETLTFGEKIADRVSEFGGSWFFIITFVTIMLVWVLANTLWFTQAEAFDPYPFILLNLVLSTLAALQAPIIMMSQNRQSTKDRLANRLNYEVSLKTDIEIMQLHQKIDELTQIIKTHNKQ